MGQHHRFKTGRYAAVFRTSGTATPRYTRCYPKFTPISTVRATYCFIARGFTLHDPYGHYRFFEAKNDFKEFTTATPDSCYDSRYVSFRYLELWWPSTPFVE